MPSFRRNRRTVWLAIVALTLASCNFEDVTVKDITDIQINELDKDGISLTAKLRVDNPNGFRFKIVSTDADLYLDGRKAGKTKLLENVVVPANFDDVLEVKVRTDFEAGSLQLIPIVLGAVVSKKVDLQAKGTVKARSFLISHTEDFDYSHQAEF